MTTLQRKVPILAAFILTAAAPQIQAQPDAQTLRYSIVQVVAMDDGGTIRRVRSGFAISGEGRVLTVAHGVANADRIVVVPLATGAELPARVIHANERSDLALLAVNSLQQPPLALAKDGFAPGRLVYSAGVWGEPGQNLLVAAATDEVPASMTEGAVGQHGEIAAAADRPAVSLLLHNAMIPAAGYGGPLLNECGEVAGLNRGAPDLRPRQLRNDQAPDAVVHAAAGSAIAGLLLPAGVPLTQSDASCKEAKAVAEARAAAAQAETEAAQAQAEAAAAQAGQAQAQAEEAQAQAEQAARQVEEKNAALAERQQALEQAEVRVAELEAQHEEAVRTGAAEAESLQAELDGARGEREAAQAAVSSLEKELATLRTERQAEAEANRRRMIVLAVAALLAAAIVAIVLVVAHQRRARQLESARQQAARAEQEAAQAHQEADRVKAEAQAPPPTVADCLLTGETGTGRPVSIKVPGSLLIGEGAVIGRSPRNATFLIDDETLSREHARLRCEPEGGLLIEDLDSTNGTRLNGRQLASSTPAPLANADVIELGSVKLRVAWEG